MKKCPRCGFRENPLWTYSRFDFNADYMRFEEAMAQKELHEICKFLKDKDNYVPYEVDGVVFYRRGTDGIYLYRVLKEDFKVPRERKKHIAGFNPAQTKLVVVESE